MYVTWSPSCKFSLSASLFGITCRTQLLHKYWTQCPTLTVSVHTVHEHVCNQFLIYYMYVKPESTINYTTSEICKFCTNEHGLPVYQV